MEYLEQEIVKDAFNRCSFLRDLVISAEKEAAETNAREDEIVVRVDSAGVYVIIKKELWKQE